MRIVVRNLIVQGDKVLAEGPVPPVAPDWYEIDVQFKLILMGWHEAAPQAPCKHEHCKDAVCDYQRADEEMKGGETEA